MQDISRIVEERRYVPQLIDDILHDTEQYSLAVHDDLIKAGISLNDITSRHQALEFKVNQFKQRYDPQSLPPLSSQEQRKLSRSLFTSIDITALPLDTKLAYVYALYDALNDAIAAYEHHLQICRYHFDRSKTPATIMVPTKSNDAVLEITNTYANYETIKMIYHDSPYPSDYFRVCRIALQLNNALAQLQAHRDEPVKIQ